MTQAEAAKVLRVGSERRVRELFAAGTIPNPATSSADQLLDAYLRHIQQVAAGRGDVSHQAGFDGFLTAYRVAFPDEPPENWPKAKRVTWAQVLEFFDIDDDELRAWLCYGAPSVRRGNIETGEGWQFHSGDLVRWSGLFFSLCKRYGIRDESLVEILEARGLR